MTAAASWGDGHMVIATDQGEIIDTTSPEATALATAALQGEITLWTGDDNRVTYAPGQPGFAGAALTRLPYPVITEV